MRAFLVVIHRWLTFLLGLFLASAAGSGALLVYEHEIDHWLNASRYEPTPGDVGWRVVKAAVERAHPEARVELIWWPRWNVPIYEAHIEMNDGTLRTVGVDPGTGVVLPPAMQRNRVMEAVNTFHTTLLTGDVGWWLVVSSTVAALFLAVTGIWLWWPGLRRFARGLRVRSRNAYTLNFDLHQVTGALISPVLIVMCMTGVALAFPQGTSDFLHSALGEDPPEEVYWLEVKSGPRPPGFDPSDRPSYDELLAHAHREVPGAETFYLTFPSTDDDPIHIRLQTGTEPKPFGLVSRLAYDQYTGELIQVVDPRRTAIRAGAMEEWIHTLHMGRFWGPVGRWTYILSCLVVGLFGTGLYVWWEKRRRTELRPARAREGSRAPAPRPVALTSPPSRLYSVPPSPARDLGTPPGEPEGDKAWPSTGQSPRTAKP